MGLVVPTIGFGGLYKLKYVCFRRKNFLEFLKISVDTITEWLYHYSNDTYMTKYV
ncbi:hypothetical protein FACS1894141_4060 [Spirochaetia bacterium]|nr:hypothetical protein FACS1894141_4060 [Spirochaetia bacterium]